MRIILVGYGVVGKGVTSILTQRYNEKVKDGFNPKIVAIADIDGAVINPRGLSPEKLEAIKQKGYPISADKDFGVHGIKALDVIKEVAAEVVVEVTPVNIQTAEPAISHITQAFRTGKHVVTTNKGPLALAMPRSRNSRNTTMWVFPSGHSRRRHTPCSNSPNAASLATEYLHQSILKRHNQLHLI
jgi:homoserine dehydrogenase